MPANLEAAYDAGVSAFRAKRFNACPYPQGSDEAEAYGWAWENEVDAAEWAAWEAHCLKPSANGG